MTDELNDGEQPLEVGSQAPEAATGQEAEPTEKPANGYEKRISTLTSRNYQSQAQIDQLTAENETLRAAQTQEAEIVIPDMPDDDLRVDDPTAYRQKIKERDDALIGKASSEAIKASRLAAQADREANAKATQQTQHQDIVNNYIDGGLNDGISEVQLQANEAVLRQHQINPQLAQFLYSQKDGAKLVDHLAKTPQALVDLNGMDPMSAAIEIANVVRPQALAKTPVNTGAPDPVTPTRGGGAPPGDEWADLAPGATFE